MRALLRVVVMAAACAAGGCVANMNSIHREFDLGENKSQLIDAKQRAIFVAKGKDNRPIVCPEPSPDTLSVYAASLAANGETPNVSLGAAAGSSESGSAFGLRTQSIQLQRDAYTALCLAYLSGAEDKYEYRYMLRRYGNQVVALLAIEQLTQAIRPQIANISAQAPALPDGAGVSPRKTTSSTTTTTTTTTPPPDPKPAPAAPATAPATGQSTSYTPNIPGQNGGFVFADYKVAAADPPPAAPDKPATPAKPTCAFTPANQSIVAGDAAKLSWTTSNAKSFAIDGIEAAKTADTAKGSADVSPGETKTYKGTATGDGGKAACSTTVNVAPKAEPAPQNDFQSVASVVKDIAEDVLKEDYAAQMCFSYFEKIEDPSEQKRVNSEPLYNFCAATLKNSSDYYTAYIKALNNQVALEKLQTDLSKDLCENPKNLTKAQWDRCSQFLLASLPSDDPPAPPKPRLGVQSALAKQSPRRLPVAAVGPQAPARTWGNPMTALPSLLGKAPPTPSISNPLGR